MTLRRRDFLRLAGTAAATLAVGGLEASDAADGAGASDRSLGVLVDATVCIGCRKCEWACNREHELTARTQADFEDRTVCVSPRRPSAEAFTVVNRFPTAAEPDRGTSVKVQCMHCLRPACVSACLVGALRKEPEGPVTYDAGKCMGCRYCMVACPFEIPTYEYAEALAPRVRKCSFCFERVVGEGRRPACVDICPNEALTFGRRDALVDAAHVRMKAAPERYSGHLYGEHEVGGTAWMYLAPGDIRQLGLPALPERPAPDATEPIQHGIFKGFVPPLALYGLLGLVMLTTRQERRGDDHGASGESGT